MLRQQGIDWLNRRHVGRESGDVCRVSEEACSEASRRVRDDVVITVTPSPTSSRGTITTIRCARRPRRNIKVKRGMVSDEADAAWTSAFEHDKGSQAARGFSITRPPRRPHLPALLSQGVVLAVHEALLRSHLLHTLRHLPRGGRASVRAHSQQGAARAEILVAWSVDTSLASRGATRVG